MAKLKWEPMGTTVNIMISQGSVVKVVKLPEDRFGTVATELASNNVERRKALDDFNETGKNTHDLHDQELQEDPHKL